MFRSAHALLRFRIYYYLLIFGFFSKTSVHQLLMLLIDAVVHSNLIMNACGSRQWTGDSYIIHRIIIYSSIPINILIVFWRIPLFAHMENGNTESMWIFNNNNELNFSCEHSIWTRPIYALLNMYYEISPSMIHRSYLMMLKWMYHQHLMHISEASNNENKKQKKNKTHFNTYSIQITT